MYTSATCTCIADQPTTSLSASAYARSPFGAFLRIQHHVQRSHCCFLLCIRTTWPRNVALWSLCLLFTSCVCTTAMDSQVARDPRTADVWDLIDGTTVTFTAAAEDVVQVAPAWQAVHRTACSEVRQSAHGMSVVLLRQVCVAVLMIRAWLAQHRMLDSAWVGPDSGAGVPLSEASIRRVHKLNRNDNRTARFHP